MAQMELEGVIPTPKTIEELTILVHKIAREKGWWDSIREAGTMHMLMVSEIAEATEEARKGSAPIYYNPNSSKPEGELIELADAVIRIMDYCGFLGWNLQKAIELKIKYNETRDYKHGGKAF
jgi:hypothetical protein